MRRNDYGRSKTHIGLGLIVAVVFAQAPDVYARQSTTPVPQTASSLKLDLVIVEGEGAINNVKQRVSREVIVQVNDENKQPIGGAAVTFLLPTSGPSGSFANGTTALNVTTNAAGRATVQFTPNSLTGNFQINISASYQGQVATTVISQTNTLAVAAGAAGAGAAGGAGAGAGGVSATTIAIIAAAAAGAATVAVVATKKGDPQETVKIGVSGAPVVSTPGFQPSNRKMTVIPKWNPGF